MISSGMINEYAAKSRRVADLVNLAGTYFDDGAPRGAAAKLREAADLLDELAIERDAMIAGPIQ